MKHKVIDFAPINKPIMASKFLTTNLEQFLRNIKISAYALKARNISRIIFHKLAVIAIFKPP